VVIIFEFNYRGVAYCILIIILCYAFLVSVSYADSNGSYVIVTGENTTFASPSNMSSTIAAGFDTNVTIVNGHPVSTLREPAYNNTRISQGQCIEIGGVYDVSGVIGFAFTTPHNMFAYYGRYEDAFDPSLLNSSMEYLHQMPDKREAYYKFYVDPDIFGERFGYWYQYTGMYERSANKRAFYVSDRCIAPADQTSIIVDNKPMLINPRVMEPRESGADILVSTDDPLMSPRGGVARVWVFGPSSVKSFGVETNLTEGVVYTQGEMDGWTPGDYTLLLQYPGADGDYGVVHDQDLRGITIKSLLVPSLRRLDVVDITGYQSQMVRDSLVSILDKTDDKYFTYNVLVESPSVDISGYQQIEFGGQHLLEITGYTNKMGGTPVTIYVDRDAKTGKSLKYPGMTFTTENATASVYRTFHGFIPLYYENIAAGFHTIEAVLPSGKSMAVDFYIREELDPPYQEPKHYKFVDGNPYIPEPTPIVIEKEVVREVVKTEYKTIIEKEPVDYVTLAWVVISNLIVPAIAIVAFAVIPLAYVISLVVRAFAERRKRNSMENQV